MEPTELNNQEEQYGQPEQAAEETQPVAPAENVAEPADLADAFAALRAQNASSTDQPVANAEGVDPNEYELSDLEPVNDTSYGEPAGYEPRTNWAAKDAETKRGIQQAAIQQVNAQWRQQGKRPIEIDELTRRDEQTGRLYYIDIYDDPKEWDQPGYRGTDKATARQHMKEFNEYYNNLGCILSRGKEQARVLVIHPIQSVWAEFSPLHKVSPVFSIWAPKNPNAGQNFITETERYQKPFMDLTALLAGAGIAFHYGDEMVMADHGRFDDGIAVGRCRYRQVVVPPVLEPL